MTAGLVLAVMMIPIVTAISREVLATVAQDEKNAALAMGATRWEMLRACVFPRARSGLVGRGHARHGARARRDDRGRARDRRERTRVTSHVFQPGDSMAAVIAHEFGEAASEPMHRAALIGLAVLLFVFTLLVNVVARWFASRARPDGGRMTTTAIARRPRPRRRPRSWRTGSGTPDQPAPPRREPRWRRSG